MVEVIPNKAKVGYVQYTPKVSALCEIGKSPFHAIVDISYMPEEKLLEFESFEVWLRSLGSVETTIEGLTRIIFDKVFEVLGDVKFTVTLSAETVVHAPVTVVIDNRLI